jgi:catechol 2,3-dioxygenase-like lactoylglutathione lyase family enzyme
MPPKPNLSIVTLGVHDLARSTRFCEAMGWKALQPASEGVAFFELNGVILALFPRAELAKDAGVEDSEPGFSGISLACNVGSEEEADEALAHAASCGATLVKSAHKVFWGGYSGYFADPEGHLWEVAYNPFGQFDERGQFRMT